MSCVKKFHFNLSVLLCLLSLAIGLYMFINSMGMNYWSGYGPGEGFAPRWISGGLIIFSALSAISAAREAGVKFRDIFPEGKKERINLIVAGVGLVVFLILVEYLGFLLGSIPLMIVILSRGFSWKPAVPLGIVLSVICYLLFGTLLEVPLPPSPFGF